MGKRKKEKENCLAVSWSRLFRFACMHAEVIALDRKGEPIGKGKVVMINKSGNHTAVVTIVVGKKMAMDVRNIRRIV